MTTGPYTPDEHPVRYSDVWPGKITPLPDGVPSGMRVRVVATERFLTVLWQGGSGPDGPMIGRVDVEMVEGTVSGDNFGGSAGPYVFSKLGGCGCGANALKSYRPFPGITFAESTRRVTNSVRPYGVPSNSRFTRTR